MSKEAAMNWKISRSVTGFLVLGVVTLGMGQEPRPKVLVKITDEKPTVVEPVLPIDPTQRIQYQPQGNLSLRISNSMGRNLHLSHYTVLQVDGQFIFPGNGGQFEVNNGPLSKTPGGKARLGFMSVWKLNDLRITMTAEVVPTRPPKNGTKRLLNSVLVRYQVENKGKQSHKVGVRPYFDTYIIDNDGALFAAPNFPKKILDGIELKDKQLPDYVQVLQRPDLANPGFVAHLTLNLGGGIEKPNRIILTRHGAFRNQWDMQAVQAMGDSAMAVYWDPRDVKPGGKREVGYAYGEGIAYGPASAGNVSVNLGGSFEPGKVFTIAAMVNDPAPGQSLTLELPDSMERVEGKRVQPVPTTGDDQEAQTMVLWKARVLRTGEFPIRIRSSTGVTLTKVINISEAENGK
jgi:hypothetical protein